MMKRKRPLTEENPSQQQLLLLHKAETRPHYSLEEFALMVGISYMTAWREYRRGHIKRCGTTKKILIPRSEVDRFLAPREFRKEAA
jgi:hypothetical protein